MQITSGEKDYPSITWFETRGSLTIRSPYVQSLSEIAGISFTIFSSDILRQTRLMMGELFPEGTFSPSDEHLR